MGKLAAVLLSLAVCGASAALNTTTYWFGNTYSGGLTPSKYVQLNMEEIAVFRDGRVLASCQWDEAGRAVCFYKDGDVLGPGPNFSTNWGGSAIAYDEKYIFVARMDRYLSGSDPAWYGVSRSNLDGSPSTFANAKGQGSIKNLCVLYTAKKDQQPEGGKPIPGLALWKNELHVADAAANTIVVFDKDSMTRTREFPLVPATSLPGKMIFDKTGHLWICQFDSSSNTYSVCQYDSSGTPTNKRITDISRPSAVALDNSGRLMLADIGTKRQQVRWYSVSGTPTVADSFGISAFSGSAPGRVEPGRFAGITGVGVDSAGNLYISENGIGPGYDNHFGAKLWKFNAARQYQWVLDGLLFMDCASVDPGADTNVYTRGGKFVLNYGLPTQAASSHPSWRHAGRLVDPFTYPNDPRIVRKDQLGSEVIRIQNHLFLASTENDNSVCIYRLNGDLSILAAIFMNAPNADWPPNNPYGRIAPAAWKAVLWVDKNGNGQFESSEFDTINGIYAMNNIRASHVDARGTVWVGESQNNAMIHKFALDSINSFGVPCYSRFSRVNAKAPASITQLGRLRYLPDLDRMYILCYSAANPAEIWNIAGREIRRYDHWSTTRDSIFSVPVIYKYTNNRGSDFQPAAMDVDEKGDYIFVGYDWGSDDAHNRGEVVVYSGKDGSEVGTLNHRNSPEIGSNSGCLDFGAAVRAHKRADGTFVVFVEDDAYAKVIYYQWNPSGVTDTRLTRKTAETIPQWCRPFSAGVGVTNPFSRVATVRISDAAGRVISVARVPGNERMKVLRPGAGAIYFVTIDGAGYRLDQRVAAP